MIKIFSSSRNLVLRVKEMFHKVKPLTEAQQKTAGRHIYYITQAINSEEVSKFYNRIGDLFLVWEEQGHDVGEIETLRQDADLAAKGDPETIIKYYSYKPTEH